MTVVTLRLDLRVLKCPTPRDARRQMGAIMDKLHRHFNVSVAESEPPRGDDPGAAVLAVAAVGRTRREARETVERVADAVAAHPRVEVLDQAFTEV